MVTSVNGNAVPNVAGTGQTAASGAAPSAPVSAGVGGSAAYLAGLLAAASPAVDPGSSGLRSPVNPENSEALLLLVESQLDQAVAANRGAGLAARFGAAQNAIADTTSALKDASTHFATAQNKLAADQAQLASDQAKQADPKRPSGDMSAAIAADEDAITADTAQVAQTYTALQSLQASAILSAVSLVAKGLRADVAQDASHVAGRSARRDIAYEDVADTAKRFREHDLDRTREEEPRGSKQDGAKLAADYAVGVADALAILQSFAAAPPPVVSQTAAIEAGGRLRLSL